MNVSPDNQAGRHFQLHLFSVVSRIVENLEKTFTGEPDEEYFNAFPFLNGYRETLREIMPEDLQGADKPSWWQERIDALETQVTAHLPLSALKGAGGLSEQEIHLLVGAGLVEEDIRFGSLFAALQAPLQSRRPCVGVFGWLLSEPGSPPLEIWPACQRLLDMGLLVAENRSEPRSEWVLRVPVPIWDTLRGRVLPEPAPNLSLQAAEDFPELDDLILPDEALWSQVSMLPRLLADGQGRTLVLRGMSGSGRRTTLGTVARATGRDLLLWKPGTPGDESWTLAGGLALLGGLMPVLRLDLAPGETLELPAFKGYAGPVGITLGHSGGLRGALVEQAISLNLPPPDVRSRRRFWEATGVSIVPSAFVSRANPRSGLDEIAGRFLLTGGNIQRAAAMGQAYAALDQRQEVTVDDIRAATQALNRQGLETLATRLEPSNGWSDLVVSENTEQELHALAVRCRAREELRLRAGAAFEHSLNRGVRALFSGPSGTGKTLAARALAAELQMDVYRVDLAAVVNKYIGETERNLNQVLSRAEELDVVLLLDEGDALMTRRTEVRNANDRYANLETNYLLQRLESFEGIAIITTNALQRIDTAFLRRIDVIVDLTPPGEVERLLIWRSHLPAPNAIRPALLQEIAARCALTGGQIRNAALHAALLALADATQVSDAHLEAAVLREYRKAGMAYPLRPVPRVPDQLDRLRQFIDEAF